MANPAEPVEEIKTDHMTVAVNRKPGCHIRLEMSVDKEAAQAAWSKAIKSVNKEITIPGFRKGKAPDSMVLQRFENHVNKEWHDILLNTAFNEFLSKTHLYPYSSQKSVKRAEVKSASRENGANLVLEYEARPEIPSVNFETIQLKPVKKSEVAPEEIEETLHQIQLKLGQWENVTDRPVQDGDFVDLDIEALENPPRSICKDMRFEMAKGRMGTWMRNLIKGKSINETVEGMSEKEESQPEEPGFEFKPTLCRITIKAIFKAVLPPLDDELAKKVGLKTIDELKPKIEQDLHKRTEDEMKDQMRAQVEDALLEKYHFDIPSSLIEKQRRDMVDYKMRELKKHEHSKEHLQAMAKEIEASVTSELDRAYRLFFLTRKVAEEQDIGVYEGELMSEMMKQMMLPEGQGLIDQGMNTEEVRNKLYVNVLSHKVLDFIASKATMKGEG